MKFIVSNFSVRKQPALDISRAVLLELPRNRSGPVALLILISQFLHMDYRCENIAVSIVGSALFNLCSTYHRMSDNRTSFSPTLTFLGTGQCYINKRRSNAVP
jgi:hypothetical protein